MHAFLFCDCAEPKPIDVDDTTYLKTITVERPFQYCNSCSRVIDNGRIHGNAHRASTEAPQHPTRGGFIR